MKTLDSELGRRLSELREAGLYRELLQVASPQGPRITVQGETLLNFSSNDYLGLANHPQVKQAAIDAVERHGAGSGASRLICGSLEPHHELEETLASFKSCEAALAFSTGYAAALGTICAVVGSNDIIIVDKKVHASIVDAARLSQATLRVFRHNDLNHLEHLLQWASQKTTSLSGNGSRVLVVTESVFSMDGNHAPLRGLVDLKNRYNAWLMVDEAHATGLYGSRRCGLAEETGVADQIEIQMGTLGKAIGAAGGFVCGSGNLIKYLVNKARSFVFSTAPVPAAAAAATAGIKLVQSESGEQRRVRLWELVSCLKKLTGMTQCAAQSAILPILIGNETESMVVAQSLRKRGIFIPAIRYPTVARGQARLRLTVTADHTEADIEQAAIEVGKALKQTNAD